MQNQWENGEIRQQPPESYGKRMWHIWGPLIIKWGMGFIISMMAMMVFAMIYSSTHYEEILKAMEDPNGFMELSATLTEVMMPYMTLMEGIAALITIPVMLVLFHKDRKKEKNLGIVPNKKAPVWKYAAVALIAAAMCVGLNNLIVIGNLQAVSESYEKTMETFYSAGFGTQILSLGILIPISEELVFRGLMFKRLRERTNFRQAAIYSAVVFGIFHGNLVQMIYGIILGLMLAYVYEKYGSVKAPILAHIVMNIISVVATKYNVYEWMTKDIMRIGMITVVCAAVASTMFVLIQRIEEKPELSNKSEENLAAV